MRIVIDLQGAQTDSSKRGIGRYSIALTKAILNNAGAHEILIALNGLYPKAAFSVRQALAGLMPQENILSWGAVAPVSYRDTSNRWRRAASQLTRENFLESLEPDLILISSLFEGFHENAILSVPKRERFGPKVGVIIYDLVPYRYPQMYLADHSVFCWYTEKLAYLKKADIWLAISESTRQEAIEAFNLPSASVTNISGAVDDCFKKVSVAPAERKHLLKSYGITGRFILTTGGGEPRKNVERLLAAFARLPNEIRTTHQVVVYGCSNPDERVLVEAWCSTYGLGPNQIVVTDYIKDNELNNLYNLCDLFVFPSWHEGFGFPALEAMRCGAPTIVSRAASLPEVVGREDAFFDPYSADDITAKIVQVLTNGDFRGDLAAYGPIRAHEFSWARSAQRAVGAIEEACEKQEGRRHKSRRHLYRTLIEKIGEISSEDENGLTDDDVVRCAEVIVGDQEVAAPFRRRVALPEKLTWRIEGPFDSSYSLALLNRETARALSNLGHNVVLHSTEGPGDFLPSKEFLINNPDINELYSRCASVSQMDCDVLSRNLYPPRVSDMAAQINLLHHYAWEESGFPHEWVEEFNRNLDGITCLSNHVKKILIDHGVTTALSVSGCGVDHWERVTSDPEYKVGGRSFRFLHVSSCFPRKGADRLLKAYGHNFTSEDDVTLIIKTFQNPHNEIHKWLTEARVGNESYPDVMIIEDDLTNAQLKALYEQCDVLVAPSRAEGFGVPLAEAMLSGLPVITTAWSGQLDFCTNDSVWMVDYDFELARSHFNLYNSCWAAPRVDSLAARMREAYDTPLCERRARADRGRTNLLERFRWCDVASRLAKSARIWAEEIVAPRPSIGWVTTWNTRCGIAAYSGHLIDEISEDVTILAPRNQEMMGVDGNNVIRCWDVGETDSLRGVENEVGQKGLNVIVIQFNYGFFNFESFNSFIDHLVGEGRKVVVVLHATIDPIDSDKRIVSLCGALSRCARVIVHSISDLNRLKAIGLVRNVTLFPQGALSYQVQGGVESVRQKKDILIGSYGFFLPHKGLLELIEAVSHLRDGGINVKLRMLNAEYPNSESAKLIRQAREIVGVKNIGTFVEIVTEFLTDEECLTRLSAADLIVFPYQRSTESSSAAVRYGIATGRPVAVTPLSIFEDVSPAVFKLAGFSAKEIAYGIANILDGIQGNSVEYRATLREAARWRQEHRHSRLGRRLENMLFSLIQNDVPSE